MEKCEIHRCFFKGLKRKGEERIDERREGGSERGILTGKGREAVREGY